MINKRPISAAVHINCLDKRRVKKKNKLCKKSKFSVALDRHIFRRKRDEKFGSVLTELGSDMPYHLDHIDEDKNQSLSR